MKSILIAIVLIACTGLGYTQDFNPTRAQRLYNGASTYFKQGKIKEGEENLLEAIRLDSTFTSAYYALGELYNKQYRNEECVAIFQKNARINGYRDYMAYYYLGAAQLLSGMFSEAQKNFEILRANSKVSGNTRMQINALLDQSTFGAKMAANPVPFNPVNMGENINSDFAEYLPALTADENTLLFTVLVQKEGTTGRDLFDYQEDFYISQRKNGIWQKAKNLGLPINTEANEGAQAFSPDGQVIYFTACMRQDSYGDCDIYWAQKTGDGWSAPRNIGKDINSMYRESEPTISSDGRTLYFVSDRPGGFGSFDLWKTVYYDRGGWSKPVNLGKKINTRGEEMSPFIHTDNSTLYFSSNGHLGLGGRDIYYSRKDTAGDWQEPVNLGYPINTHEDESDMFVSASGTTAYFSAIRPDGFGEKDLYMFELYEEARPIVVTYMKGTVFDSESKKKLGAHFEVINLKTGSIIAESYSNPASGEFLVCLPANNDYALNVSRDGYLFYSEHFSLQQLDAGKPFIKDVPLSPVKIGEKITLENVFFDTDSYELKQESKIELNKLVQFLKASPAVKIKINGHTDDQGSDDANMTLSDNRAKSVKKYLTDNGISIDRLAAQGYGETMPIETNSTEEGRAKNRRTEIEITEN